MEKLYDLVAFGESLIDFTPEGVNELGMQLFSCNPGGAPANVLAMFSRLGGRTAFIGKVGDDDFGRFLIRTMADAGIYVGGVQKDKVVPTTLAFVQLDERGDRSFSFYRKPGADIMLTRDEVPMELVENCRIFHFGSVSLTDEPCRTATLEAVRKARAAGAVISFDPNYRPLLWKNIGQAKTEIVAALPLTDLLKVSGEELVLLTGENDLEAGATVLRSMGPSAVLVTLGPKGAYFQTAQAEEFLPTYDVKTVDTTGAGDAFLGALLWCLKEKCLNEIRSLSADDWKQAAMFSNAAGSLTTTAKGAIPAMPEKSAIEKCLKTEKLLKN